MNLPELCRRIELILSDVDGVLTDGGVVYDNQGVEIKKFHIRDGLGIKLWQRAGYKFGVLTARTSHIVKVRASELGIDLVRQGFERKLPVAQEILRQLNLSPEQMCYIGDDLTDLPVIRHAGLGVAVADATEDVRAAASYTTRLSGGQGAVREVIETILKAQSRWEDVLQNYVGG
ncbi:MAG TPA: HAD hydrolase family protein [Pirellulaceae bacterium]|nr:HAD hydrolase family protein [Pirellulaceae bacterium]